MGIPTPHTATRVSTVEDGPRIQGEREAKPERGEPFGCFLQIPRGSEDQGSPRGRRNIKRPTLLCPPSDAAAALKPEDELEIVAPALTGPNPVKWQVVGTPEYLASPRRSKGFEFTLRRVED